MSLASLVDELDGEVRAIDQALPPLRAASPVLRSLATELPAQLRAIVQGEITDGRMAARYAAALADAAGADISAEEQHLGAACALLAHLTADVGRLLRERAAKAESDARFLAGHRSATERHLERLRSEMAPPAAPEAPRTQGAPAGAEETAELPPAPAPAPEEGLLFFEASSVPHPDGFGGSDYP